MPGVGSWAKALGSVLFACLADCVAATACKAADILEALSRQVLFNTRQRKKSSIRCPGCPERLN